MSTRLSNIAIATAIVLSSACASGSPTLDGGTDRTAFSGAKVEITSEGGIAALLISERVEHDTRTFSRSQRRICGTSCPAPSDSASGRMNVPAIDSVFTTVLEQARSLDDRDYGSTANSADMMRYTVRITSNGQIKTVRGDDGTLPAPARRIMNVVREAISAARMR